MGTQKNMLDFYKEKFGFKTTKKERSNYGVINSQLIEFDTAKEKIDFLRKKIKEHGRAIKWAKDNKFCLPGYPTYVLMTKYFLERLKKCIVINDKKRRKEMMSDITQEFVEKSIQEETETLVRLNKELTTSQNLLKSIDDYIMAHKDSNRINQDTRLALINIKSDLKCDIHGLQETIAKI